MFSPLGESSLSDVDKFAIGIPVLGQRHFRFRTDGDSADATPTWGADEDAAYAVGANPFRLRTSIVNAGFDPVAGEYKLYLKRNSASYAAITTSSTEGVQAYDASSDADDTIIRIPRLSLLLQDLFPDAVTLNPADKGTNNTLSNGNLTVTCSQDAWIGVRTTNSIPASSKKYWSLHVDSMTYYVLAQVAKSTVNMDIASYSDAGVFTLLPSGVFYCAGSVIDSNGPTFGVDDRIDIAFDSGANLVWLRVNNGNWNNDAGANPATGTGGRDTSTLTGTLYPCGAMDVGVMTFQFATSSWTNPAPSGFSQIDA